MLPGMSFHLGKPCQGFVAPTSLFWSSLGTVERVFSITARISALTTPVAISLQKKTKLAGVNFL
jgi:hypothetical protein